MSSGDFTDSKDDFFSKIKRGTKKWRLEIFISTLHSEMLFEAETSEFCCEIKF